MNELNELQVNSQNFILLAKLATGTMVDGQGTKEDTFTSIHKLVL